MTQGHPVLKEFQYSCQKHYACFVLSVGGLNSQKSQYVNSPSGARVFFSDKDPAKHLATATLQVRDLQQYLDKDGAFADALAKSLIVAIYSEWDEYYRPKFAKAIGVKKNQVKCPLIGDVRIIRNCIVHDNSELKEKQASLKTLNWSLKPGKLLITQEMFGSLIKQANSLEVQVINEQGLT